MDPKCVEFELLTEGDTYLPGDDFYADIADPNFYDPSAAISFYVQDYVDASGAMISGGGVNVETGNIPHQSNELQIANAVLEIMPNVDRGYTSPGGDGYYDPTMGADHPMDCVEFEELNLADVYGLGDVFSVANSDGSLKFDVLVGGFGTSGCLLYTSDAADE